MNIAVLPARGGSARIPRKNIRSFCGKPIITWAIETAIKSQLFEHVIVSTDDAEIREVALKAGAECPFERPAALADEHATTTAVMAHATRWAIDAGWAVEAVCCIYPTAPFVAVDDLKRGLDALQSGAWAFAIAATEFDAPVFRAFRARREGGIEMLYPEHYATRSQDLPQVLHDAGQFYWGRPSAWLAQQRVFDTATVPVLIPKCRVQDIDSLDDWERAELMYRCLHNHVA